MSSFADDLAAAKAKRQSEPETATVQVVLNGSLVELRFTEMDPLDWANIGARFPMRPDTPIDIRYGYNVHGACRAAAPLCGVRVVDGADVPLEVYRDEKTGKVIGSEWDTLLDVVSGHEFTAICSAIWGLNEWYPEDRIEAAKKASPPPSAETSI